MKIWGVLIVGLLLGLAGGLIYTWFLAPVQYYDTYPPLLSAQYRQEWIKMVSWAYAADPNSERTAARLQDLDPDEVRVAMGDVLELAVAEGTPLTVLQRLAQLAQAHGVNAPAVAIYARGEIPPAVAMPESSPPPATATSSPPTATPTRTPFTPTQTPSPTPPAQVSVSPFTIVTQTLSCQTVPTISVSLELSRTVQEGRREYQELVELPMREVWLIWDGGADRALTGLKPQQGLGYADFAVEPERSYNLYIDSPTGPPILTIQIEPCPPDEGVGWVSRFLKLRMEEPPELEATPTLTPTVRASPTPSVEISPNR